MPRKQSKGMRVDLDTTAMTVAFQLVDFDADKILRTESYSAEDFTGAIEAQLTLYGLSKVLQDRTSDVGKIDKEDKFAAMGEVHARLVEGEWKALRKRGVQTVRVEVEALADMKRCSIPDIQQALKGYTDDQKATIFSSDDLKPFIDKVKKAREAAPVVSLDELLAPTTFIEPID